MEHRNIRPVAWAKSTTQKLRHALFRHFGDSLLAQPRFNSNCAIGFTCDEEVCRHYRSVILSIIKAGMSLKGGYDDG